MEHDYVIMKISIYQGTHASINYGDNKFEEISIRDDSNYFDKKLNDTNEVIKLINRIEGEGYELFSNNYSCAGDDSRYAINYFLFRRERKK
jgi:hypothetical protein